MSEGKSKQAFREQELPVKVIIIVFGGLSFIAALGLAVWITGTIWKAAIGVWS